MLPTSTASALNSDAGSRSETSPSGSSHPPARRLFRSLRTVSLWTLASRVLGLLRDMAMAATFGNGAVLDAFTVAFRIPNLARMLFGEGALTAAFLPLFVGELQKPDRRPAWQLATAVLVRLATVLILLVVVAELVLLGLAWWAPISAETRLLIQLTATLLPYLVLICLAAQVSAIMHALDHFTWPALLPVLLNILWLLSLWLIVPRFESPEIQILAMAACVVAAGGVQLAAPLHRLRGLGFRLDSGWHRQAGRVREILRGMLPVLIGLSITQLNTLADSLIAWGFSHPETGSAIMPLPGSPRYPLDPGTASALYFGQRLYQFPLGVFGVALGTVLFPLLSRHAEQGRYDRLRDDLQLGLRLVLCIGIPASAGLMLLADPLADLFFRRGQFDADDARQTATMIAAYGSGVWAYCGLLIVHRAYYALGDRLTPLRIGMAAMTLNLTLSLMLIWILAGRGLAIGTAVAAIVQVISALWFVQKHLGRLDWRQLAGVLLRVMAATLLMFVVCQGLLSLFPPTEGFAGRSLALGVPFLGATLTYLVAARLLGLDELGLLLDRGGPPRE